MSEESDTIAKTIPTTTTTKNATHFVTYRASEPTNERELRKYESKLHANFRRPEDFKNTTCSDCHNPTTTKQLNTLPTEYVCERRLSMKVQKGNTEKKSSK